LSGKADCFSDSIAEIVVLVSFVAWPDPIRCRKKKDKHTISLWGIPSRLTGEAVWGRARLTHARAPSGLAHERGALAHDAHAWIAGLPSGLAHLHRCVTGYQLGSIFSVQIRSRENNKEVCARSSIARLARALRCCWV
jgi:hypothetical protein